MVMAAPVAFAVDKMLGRLARWLRILGHDVAYGPHLGGRTLASCARREGRLLLTRDTRLVRDPDLPPHLFVASDHFREQLRQVAAAVPLGGRFLGRCLDCNRPIEPVEKDAVRERVPPYVFATQAAFHRCSGCGRLYWAATHRTRMLAELAALGLEPGANPEVLHG
jgi:uncharacterized protein with PIN domain